MSAPLLPIEVRQTRWGRRYVALLELDADECQSVAYALGLHDAGAQQLLDTASGMLRRVDDGDPA